MTRLLALLLALGACVDSEGEVLSSLGRDGGGSSDGGDGADAGPLDCSQPLPCPAPPPGALTVCGTVIDLETSQPLDATAPALELRIWDLADFTMFGEPVATPDIDGCGRFVAEDLGGLFSGFLIVQTQDTGDDAYRATATIVSASPGQTVRTNAWALPDAVEQAWTDAASLSSGGFASRGSLLAVFIDLEQPPVGPFQGTPVAGVTLEADAFPPVAEDHYFADGSALQRSAIDPGLDQTQTNGTVIMPNALFTNEYTGTRAGCDFANERGIGAPGVVQVQELHGTCE